ncbi:MAG: sirohydrochlorin chelatase [Cyanobacteria bacterium P01_E01_bin.42]
MSSAFLLVWHGSRDRRPHLAISQLTALIAQELQAIAPVSAAGNTLILPRPPLIDAAALELGSFPLSESILRFARQAKSQGCQRVKIYPLFLLEGVHVREDIPAEVAIARSQLQGEIELELLPHLGSRWQAIELLAGAFSALPAGDRILLAHGSRKTSAQQSIGEIARQLNARPAYWRVLPNLEMQISHLVTNEQKDIVIQPYFLFTGRITDAIAREFRRLQEKFTDANLYLGQPFGATPALARLIRDGIDL